eukprot:5916515-Pleurochrysis_carterae.AAC.1
MSYTVRSSCILRKRRNASDSSCLYITFAKQSLRRQCPKSVPARTATTSLVVNSDLGNSAKVLMSLADSELAKLNLPYVDFGSGLLPGIDKPLLLRPGTDATFQIFLANVAC